MNISIEIGEDESTPPVPPPESVTADSTLITVDDTTHTVDGT